MDADMIANNMTPYFATHPGEVLKDEVTERGLSQKELASKIGMSYKALNDILNERRPLSTETALLFEAALGISAKTLMSLQVEYNMVAARNNKAFLERLTKIKHIAAVL